MYSSELLCLCLVLLWLTGLKPQGQTHGSCPIGTMALLRGSSLRGLMSNTFLRMAVL